jgi:hypothetical protein
MTSSTTATESASLKHPDRTGDTPVTQGEVATLGKMPAATVWTTKRRGQSPRIVPQPIDEIPYSRHCLLATLVLQSIWKNWQT